MPLIYTLLGPQGFASAFESPMHLSPRKDFCIYKYPRRISLWGIVDRIRFRRIAWFAEPDQEGKERLYSDAGETRLVGSVHRANRRPGCLSLSKKDYSPSQIRQSGRCPVDIPRRYM